MEKGWHGCWFTACSPLRRNLFLSKQIIDVGNDATRPYWQALWHSELLWHEGEPTGKVPVIWFSAVAVLRFNIGTICFWLSVNDLGGVAHRAITEFVFQLDNPVEADYTVVLGMSLWARPVDVACALYDRGIAGKLIFTGGYNHRIGGTEAEAMAVKALAAGIPPGDIFCESCAAHTRENLEFSWNIMKAVSCSVGSVNLIVINYHVTRALFTARSVFPPEIRLGHVSYPSIYFGRESWQLSERGRRDVFNELSKLQAYFPETMPQELKSLFS